MPSVCTVTVYCTGFTVTVQVSVNLPSSVSTLMLAVPAPTAVTRPFASTVATLSLSLLQVTALLVALAGSTVAVRVSVLPTVSVVLVLFSNTRLTGTLVCSPIVILNSLLSEPPPFAALTVKLNVPSAVGVPEMTPVLSAKVRPSGKVLPVTRLQDVALFAARVALYAVPTVPPSREVVVIVGGGFPLMSLGKVPEFSILPLLISVPPSVVVTVPSLVSVAPLPIVRLAPLGIFRLSPSPISKCSCNFIGPYTMPSPLLI